ncbi:internal scaffolding protein [Microviridae sp.]|nr:internal scaffolding protein [Microviridae sp.]
MSFAKQSPARDRTKIADLGESMTEQSHKDECDIHNILRKFEKTGMINHVAKHQGTYGDYTNALGFQEAQIVIAEAQSMFETVPSKIREEFDNDPAKFLDFIQDDDNREQMSEMGFDTSHLTPLEAPQEPISVKVIPESNNNNKNAENASKDA